MRAARREVCRATRFWKVDGEKFRGVHNGRLDRRVFWEWRKSKSSSLSPGGGADRLGQRVKTFWERGGREVSSETIVGCQTRETCTWVWLPVEEASVSESRGASAQVAIGSSGPKFWKMRNRRTLSRRKTGAGRLLVVLTCRGAVRTRTTDARGRMQWV